MSYTPATGFEGSFMGDAARIAADTRLECKICWHVYDPAEGCAHWQIPAGTPFTQLPDHWRCPTCDAAKSGFMALAAVVPMRKAEEPATARMTAKSPVMAEAPRASEEAVAAAKALGRIFEATFRDIHHGKMRDVPLINKALSVQAIGFRPRGQGVIGILLTPWFMNIVLVPEEAIVEPTGTRRMVTFASGTYEFVVAQRPETGAYLACSLFSPVHEFTTQLIAIEVALAALNAIDDPQHREEGARTSEIRAAREAELAAEAAKQAEPPTPVDVAGAVAEPDDQPVVAAKVSAVPSRRALLTGQIMAEEPTAR